MISEQSLRHTIVQLLQQMGNSREIRQYLKRYSHQDRSRFAVIKIGGAILEQDLSALAAALAFLYRVGLCPLVVHGGGPQLDRILVEAGIETVKRDGLRVTPPEVLTIARRVFIDANLRLVEALQKQGVPAASITGGVFEATPLDETKFGLVGRVTAVYDQSIRAALQASSLPVLTCLGECPDSGRILNINGDSATTALVREFQPDKVIFLTETGGILDGRGQRLSSINLATDYQRLINADWLQGGMKVKLEEICRLLMNLPLSSSVSITRPEWLPRELFTHVGAGTLVRRGERIERCDGWQGVDRERFSALLASAFRRPVVKDYFTRIQPTAVYLSENYRAAAVVCLLAGEAYMDKFAVLEDAQGEGLARALWDVLINDHPRLFWRSRQGNVINEFYYREADGVIKGDPWGVFWRGIEDFSTVRQCVQAARDWPVLV